MKDDVRQKLYTAVRTGDLVTLSEICIGSAVVRFYESFFFNKIAQACLFWDEINDINPGNALRVGAAYGINEEFVLTRGSYERPSSCG